MQPDAHSPAPNHHAHHKGFAGPTGLGLALAMAVKSRDRSRLSVQLAQVGPADTAVDVGSGPGGAVRLAARAGATAVGVDPSRVMRRVAALLSVGRPRTRYVEGTAEAVPLEDGIASVAWSVATVHHWKDVDAGLGEARRILQPGGRFVAIERHTAPDAQGLASHGWTSAQAEAFAAACRTHGFAEVRVEEHRAGSMDVLAVLATAS
jgi:ubiquinone/menaquinone biosynthesis C-methylase UbiE